MATKTASNTHLRKGKRGILVDIGTLMQAFGSKKIDYRALDIRFVHDPNSKTYGKFLLMKADE